MITLRDVEAMAERTGRIRTLAAQRKHDDSSR